MGRTWALDDRAQLHKSAVASLDATLDPDESVRVIIRGIQDSAFIGTDRRLFVFKKTLWNEKMSSWDYRSVGGVEFDDKGPLFPGYVRVNAIGSDNRRAHASDNALQIAFSEKKAAAAGTAELRRLISAYRAPTTSAQTTPADPLDQIKKAADLRDAGVLSEEEFQETKRRLLDL
jgi:hypothetical protein